MSKLLKKRKGFTLIEILVVVGLIAILATITIVAINPGKNFKDTRNANRRADISQILSAINQYLTEEGNSVATLTSVSIPSCTATPGSVAIGTDTGNVDLTLLVTGDYIPAIPKDPSSGDDLDTGYTICMATATRVQIAAPNAEPTGSVTPVR